MFNLTKSKKKPTTIWAIEDVNEYNYFSSHNKQDVIDFINNSEKIQENDNAFLVVTYPDSKSFIPDDVKTVRTFMIPDTQV